ncbi:regulator of chromosome condensation 1/beta-lactamase-inhibitor protein II [Thamnidium elegans]|uniref:RCC1-like domain-containing protein n=1 Tax=Thamnidium elegans TaxID=101142 RepID=A0A8H7SNH9_9FUNG|nr:hypothetical protein INT48_004437 [Thamnidium elegans]KAI8068877.1 regulator of chromosome condensation 1/beta-lactamase-inhibitor protein II [Thamnidium elegans]
MTQLLGFGSNGNGQLGIGHLTDTNIPTPCKGIPSTETIEKITGGGNHSAVITSSGRLYMTGSSQLGEHVASSAADPQYQQRWDHFIWKDVACGWAFTLLLSDTNQVYGVGTSKWNELDGNSTQDLVAIAPTQLKDIISIACGWRHSLALDRTGQVYGWGCGRHGQLGPSLTAITDKKDIRTVQKIITPQPIVQIVCGHVHTLLRGKDGTVYGFGSNKYGQLGQISADHIILANSVFIDAGWHHSASLDQNGNLTMWGRKDHGQVTDQPLNNIKSVACGSEHTLVITNNGNVTAWGWNEHGNCTTDKDFIDTPITLPQTHIKIIGAGCATSWFGL